VELRTKRFSSKMLAEHYCEHAITPKILDVELLKNLSYALRNMVRNDLYRKEPGPEGRVIIDQKNFGFYLRLVKERQCVMTRLFEARK